MILLMLSSGLRSGEARGLKWESLKNSALTIDHQIQFVTRVEKDGTRSSKEEISELKTASSYRKIPLPESVSKALKKHKIKQTEMKLLLGKEYHDEGFIFTRGDGKLLGRRRLGRRLEKLEDEFKLTKVTPHGLRHTYCTRLIEENIPVKTIQSLLGHSDIKTTLNIYAHVTGDGKDEAVKKYWIFFA